MRSRARAAVELVTAVAAAVGCVLAWRAAGTTVTVPPVLEGEPRMTAVDYNAPLIGLTLLLATAAGVLLVLGVARLRRSQAPK